MTLRAKADVSRPVARVSGCAGPMSGPAWPMYRVNAPRGGEQKEDKMFVDVTLGG